MQSIIQWTVSLVVLCGVGAVILFLSPSSSLSKSVKTIVVLCVLTTFFAPLVNISFNEIFSNENIEENDETVQDLTQQMLRYAVLEAEELVDSFVKESECVAEKIEAQANIDQDNSIYISNIKLYMKERYIDKEKLINEKIRNVFNIDGEFSWEKE